MKKVNLGSPKKRLNSFGLNLSLGYSVQMVDLAELDYQNGHWGVDYENKNSGAVTLKVGFDF